MRTFREAIQNRDFVLTAQLDLTRESDQAAILEQSAILAPQVDALQVPDNPDGRVQLTPLAVSGILLRNGIDPVAHLGCRDRNRLALESELLSLGAAGVTSLFLLRGDDLPAGHRPRAREVFEVGGRKLIEAARALADDPTAPAAPDFCIGTAAMVFNPKAGWRPSSLLAKVEAGARFIQTQLCFDTAALRRYMTHLVDAQLTWRCAIIVSVATLPSAVSARWLREHLRGSLVPVKVIRRLEQARDPESEGVAICAELLQELRDIPGVSGANLLTPGDPGTVAAAIRASGVRG